MENKNSEPQHDPESIQDRDTGLIYSVVICITVILVFTLVCVTSRIQWRSESSSSHVFGTNYTNVVVTNSSSSSNIKFENWYGKEENSTSRARTPEDYYKTEHFVEKDHEKLVGIILYATFALIAILGIIFKMILVRHQKTQMVTALTEYQRLDLLPNEE